MRPLPTLAALAALALPASAQDFPLAIETKFGEAVIETLPERVASLDFNGADNLLALGVQPVVIRHWYGDHPRSVWPWAEPLLEETPEILRGPINVEQVATTDPDVILALWSGITAAEHEQLAKIAPVVAVPEGVGDYGLPWDELALLAGRAVGREAEAERQVDAIRDRLAAIRAEHPEWQGMTAAVGYHADGTPGVYTRHDIRPQLLAEMGFIVPPAVDALTQGGAFAIPLSEEALEPLDADLLVWVAEDGSDEAIRELALRPSLRAVREGREVIAMDRLTGAFSHATLLSLPYALDLLVPAIEAAVDGDPATAVPATE